MEGAVPAVSDRDPHGPGGAPGREHGLRPRPERWCQERLRGVSKGILKYLNQNRIGKLPRSRYPFIFLKDKQLSPSSLAVQPQKPRTPAPSSGFKPRRPLSGVPTGLVCVCSPTKGQDCPLTPAGHRFQGLWNLLLGPEAPHPGLPPCRASPSSSPNPWLPTQAQVRVPEPRSPCRQEARPCLRPSPASCCRRAPHAPHWPLPSAPWPLCPPPHHREHFLLGQVHLGRGSASKACRTQTAAPKQRHSLRGPESFPLPYLGAWGL